MKMDVWEPFQLYLMIVLVWLPVSTRSGIVGTPGGEIRKENTTNLSDLLCKIRSWKGANVSWVSQRRVALHLYVVIRRRMRSLSLHGLGWQWEWAAPDRRQGSKSLQLNLLFSRSGSWLRMECVPFDWTHLLPLVSCPPSTAHQYIFCLPSAAVVSYTPFQNFRYPPDSQPDYRGTSHYRSLMRRTDLLKTQNLLSSQLTVCLNSVVSLVIND